MTPPKPPTPRVPMRTPILGRDALYDALESSQEPLIFTDALKDWPAGQRWTFDWFASEHGDLELPVEWLQYGSDGPKEPIKRVGTVRTMKMRDYVSALRGPDSEKLGYLIGKDLFMRVPSLRDDLRFPAYEVQRKLTEQLFFMGPRGTFTQLHLDRAHNMHAVMVGRKRWQLYAPTRDRELAPAKLDHVWSVVSRHDLVPHGGNPEALPGNRVPDFDFVLEAGEILFLPYGWWHRVLTVEPAIATNYWWWTWSMLARIGPHLMPSLAMSAVSRMRRSAVHHRRFQQEPER
ncbi:cupin-like domain-containing protein [Pyxidicoccus parkwayensis]|uniref:Cupin-like domain-containing protein n=1 Tax=Pyxidicoccus parkwayensis TaxID=2813578 RepID=A0ABX7P5B4_9BACT|nr:cupin-like domain-containing protein [Pyxidicoccus parkwaysis]QSQ25689.1 cupin-like domain-containing protein [Pyxidicoccus parkwaysis]